MSDDDEDSELRRLWSRQRLEMKRRALEWERLQAELAQQLYPEVQKFLREFSRKHRPN